MLIKNTILNTAGIVIPGLLFFPAAAFLARTLGVEQFGILLLMYAILGYSGIFDAGMTRAVIRKISQSKKIVDDQYIMGTSLITVLVLSTIPTILIFNYSEVIISWLKISDVNAEEAVQSVSLMAFAIPFFLISSVAFAYVEGKEQFFKLSIYKAFTGIMLAGMPAVMVYFYGSLTDAVIGLLCARVFTAVVAIRSLSKAIGLLGLNFKRKVLIELVNFGAWISLSNIISPVMVYMDRFILSNATGASSVAYYSAPAELIEKLAILPGALAKTIFPFFSRLGSDTHHTTRIYIGLGVLLIIILLPLYMFSGFVLELWLGKPYGDESSLILKILIVGFFFNSLAQIPFAAIQAKGLAKTTALLHFLELIPYLILLFYLVNNIGLIGAAYAWSIRVAIDFFCLFYLSRKI